MKKDSISRIIVVTVMVCLGCSVLVSYSAVALRDLQETNKLVNRNANILTAAGILSADAGAVDKKEIQRLFSEVTVRLVDLRTGIFATDLAADQYEHRDAMRDPQYSRPLDRKEDIAGLGRLEYYVPVYSMRSADGKEILVLPIRGYGLWSTLFGYIALSGEDYNQVYGLTFSEHGETPGLGGEVDSPKWKAQWKGKRVFDEQGKLGISVGKSAGAGGEYANPANLDRADDLSGASEHADDLSAASDQVDALSGASLTTRGINNMLQFWFGELGYGKFMDNLKNKAV